MTGDPKCNHIFVFEPGMLCVRQSGYGDRDGSGYLQFDEEDADLRPHDEKSGDYFHIPIEHSELIAIRDFLMDRFPPDSERAHDETLAAKMQRYREALEKSRRAMSAAVQLYDNVNEFGQVTDEEFFGVGIDLIREARDLTREALADEGGEHG